MKIENWRSCAGENSCDRVTMEGSYIQMPQGEVLQYKTPGHDSSKQNRNLDKRGKKGTVQQWRNTIGVHYKLCKSSIVLMFRLHNVSVTQPENFLANAHLDSGALTTKQTNVLSVTLLRDQSQRLCGDATLMSGNLHPLLKAIQHSINSPFAFWQCSPSSSW